MSKTVTPKQAIKISKQIKAFGKTIVLAGGVFDILHLGHIRFLEKAKNQGNFLLVLLESDQNAKKRKGENRPIHIQKNRALVLSSLQSVDYVLLLPEMTTDQEYDKLISQLQPSVIATTKGDVFVKRKERQAKLINGKVAYVIERIKDQSTTKMEKLITNS